MNMKTRKVLIDANNLYVQGLIKVINDFMLEEASGYIFTEARLKNKIEKLKAVFPEERKLQYLETQPQACIS